MIINKSKILLVITCFFYSFFSYSQNITKEAKPLAEILYNIENQFDITFTFANKIVENVFIEPPSNNKELSEVIEYLKLKTHLTFTYLTTTDILINENIPENYICGYLLDVNTKTFVPNAHITVLNSSINTISNEDGFFEIDGINENQVLQISHISYPKLYLNSSDFLVNKTCLTVSITQKIEQLEEVLLQNYLTSGITVKTDNSITISTKDSGILPGLIEPDILHKIQALPGISSINETISNINIRGGTNDQNLLLWDGIKMYHSGHFFGLISAFNPYLTEKVTILKNGTSPQYNDGVSGTINIETVNEIKENAFGGAGFNFLSADAYAHIPISKKIAIQVSGRRAITDLINTPTFDQYFERAFQDSKLDIPTTIENDNIETNSNFHFFDYNFKILYNLNKNHKFRFSFLNVENSLEYQETLTTNEIDETKTSDLQQKNLAFGVYFNSEWNKNFKTQVHTYYTKYNIDAANYTLLSEQRLLQKNEVLETGIKLNSFFKLNNTIEFLNGYHYYELGVSNAEDVNLPIYIRTQKNVIRNHSLYSEVNYNNNNKTYINAGVRLNYIEKFGKFSIEPRFQALQKLNESFSVKLGGEFKSQNVTQIIDLQEDFLGVEKRRWILADNESIPIIESKQASLGINFNKKSFFFDLEGFYKQVTGITTANQGFQNQNQYIKTSGNYTIKGIEFLINRRTEKLSTWLGYTFNKNDYSFPELTPSSFPNNLDIRHSISFGNTYKYKKLEAALGVLWRTGKPHTTPVEENPILTDGLGDFINYNSPNSSRLDDYLRVDFSSTYKFNFSEKVNGLLGISILNVFNKRNILNTYYTIGSEKTINTINNTSLGITPNFTFRVNF